MSENVLLSLISMVGGVAAAYIVNVAGKKVQLGKAKRQPKDRMEQMFDGYERLIRQKDAEDDRKVKTMKALEAELTYTRETVQRLEDALEATQEELEVSRSENRQLREMLEKMREEYKTLKAHNEEMNHGV